MRRLSIYFIVTLVSFFVGTLVDSLWHFKSSPESKPLVESGSALPSVEQSQSGINDDNDTPITILVRTLSEPSSDRLIELSKNSTTTIELELGEDINDQEVSLSGDTGSEYRILQRYQTSMTISAEGPHLDLLDWRHFDSAWIPLQQFDTHRFRTLASNQMDETKFPPTTKAEIISAVEKRAGNDWPEILELVKTCQGPNDGCCGVGISSIFLCVQKRVPDGWSDMGVVEFRFPMGC